MNNSSSDSGERVWKPSSSNHEIILWCTAFILVSIAVLCANTLAIVVFIIKRLLRKRSNILLFNLAIADLIIGGTAMPMYICILYKSLRGHQWRNRILNEVYLCLDIFAGLSSMMILAVIALERAYSVFFPFRHRCASSRFYWFSVIFAWLVAGCLASLKLSTRSRRTLSPSYDNYVILTIVALALVTILAAYMAISTRIRCRKKNNNVHIVHEKQIAQAMLIVTIAFLGMWLPFYLINVIGSFDSKALLIVPPNAIYFVKLMQYCNSVVNPIIYSLKLPQFRKALRRVRYRSSLRTENV